MSSVGETSYTEMGHSPIPASPAGSYPRNPMNRSHRTLIVVDVEVIALVLSDYLQLRGCAADTAHDYETAKTLLGCASYAVALVDGVVTGHDEEAASRFSAGCAMPHRVPPSSYLRRFVRPGSKTSFRR
jgi:hypothetical protein